MTLPDFLLDLGHAVYAVDTGFERERFDAAYLVVSDGRAAFIDTGHNAAVPRLLAALDTLGLPRDAVDWVIPTHVHLDHAGGAGLLMEALPHARALIHPRGVRHLVDPTALVAGARGVYGDEVVARTYGDVRPIAPERVTESADGMDLLLGSRTLHFIDTTGHARHHHCIWDEDSRGWFTGDTFGISYPELDTPEGRYIMPSSPPVQFEPEAMRRSILRMLERQPACIYPTHFGRMSPVRPLAQQIFAQLDEIEAGALRIAKDPGIRATERPRALEALLRASVMGTLKRMRHPWSDHELETFLAYDIELNAAGVGVWLNKAVKAPSPASASPSA